MGVKGLLTFVKSHSDRISSTIEFPLLSSQLQTGTLPCLIFDGPALAYSFSREQKWQHGGDYKTLFQTAKLYFENVLASGIVPFVVFDGVLEPLKLQVGMNCFSLFC